MAPSRDVVEQVCPCSLLNADVVEYVRPSAGIAGYKCLLRAAPNVHSAQTRIVVPKARKCSPCGPCRLEPSQPELCQRSRLTSRLVRWLTMLFNALNRQG